MHRITRDSPTPLTPPLPDFVNDVLVTRPFIGISGLSQCRTNLETVIFGDCDE